MLHILLHSSAEKLKRHWDIPESIISLPSITKHPSVQTGSPLSESGTSASTSQCSFALAESRLWKPASRWQSLQVLSQAFGHGSSLQNKHDGLHMAEDFSMSECLSWSLLAMNSYHSIWLSARLPFSSHAQVHRRVSKASALQDSCEALKLILTL